VAARVMTRPLAVAHAGGAGHGPENTLLAISRALALGAHAIEVDVRLTSDQLPVLMHDATVDRTTDGHGPISSLAWDDVRSLNTGEGEKVPSLAEAAKLVAGRALLIAELKVAGGAHAIAQALIPTVGPEGAQVWSFLPQALEELAQVAPSFPRTLLVSGRDVQQWPCPLQTALRLEAIGIAIEHTALEGDIAQDVKRAGLELFAWTIDEPEEIARALDLGVDGIVSNYPDRVLALVGQHRGR